MSESDDIDDIVDARIDLKLEPILARLTALEETIDQRFGLIQVRLEEVSTRIDVLESKVPPIDPPPIDPPPVDPPPVTPTGRPKPSALRMGMNLSRPNYWTPNWPWADLMHGAHAGTGLEWMGTTPLPLDVNGWPVAVAPGQNAYTILARDVDGHVPAGQYTLTWEGTGEITLSGDASGVFTSSPATFNVTPSPSGSFDLKITKSTAGSPVRSLRVGLPGTAPTDLFRTGFVEGLKPYSVLRFMDWGNTNNSPQVQWTDRPLMTHRTWYRAVPWEAMIALANAVGADPWFCIPHKANEDYVRRLAALVKQNLRADLIVYLEYSNEIWNGGFQQTKWVEDQSTTENLRQTYAKLAVAAFKAWEAGWGDRTRLVRVLAGQAANPDVMKQELTAAGPGACDAIAHAPYIGGDLGKDPAVANWTVDQITAAMLTDLQVRWKGKMVECVALAKAHGVASIAYEGGQHLAAVDSGNSALVAKLVEANKSPKMEAVYAAYFEAWKQAGGGLFCHFTDVSQYGKSGSWGARSYFDEPPTGKSKAVDAAAVAWAR